MYQLVVCDDEKEILKRITESICMHLKETGLSCEVYKLDNSKELLALLNKQEIDILFLDIDMPYFSGMDIAKMMLEKKLKTLLVFVTSHDSLVYQSFTYHPFAFIRKSKFGEEIKEVLERIKKELILRDDKLVLKKNQQLMVIHKQDILYVEAEGNYVNIYTKQGIEKYRDTLMNMQKLLGDMQFIRCHKGYLVALDAISKMKAGQIELIDGSIIPIGRSNEQDVKRKIVESMRSSL